MSWIVENTLVAGCASLALVVVFRYVSVRPAIRHALWLLVLVKLVLPPMELPGWPPAAWHSSLGAAKHRLVARDAPRDAVPRDVELASREEPPAKRSAASPLEASGGSLVHGDPATAVPPGRTTAVRGASAGGASTPTTQRALAALWFLGGLFVLLRQAWWFARSLRLVRLGASPSPEVVERLGVFAARMGVRPPRAVVLPAISSPSLLCLGRVTLLWPRDLAREGALERASGPLLHELAHLRRRDHWVAWLECVATCVLWWHPLLWLVRRELRANAELACDAWAVWGMPRDGRRDYAEALIESYERGSGPVLGVPTLGMNASTRREFEWRLKAIMKSNHPCTLSGWKMAPAYLATLLLLPSLAGGERASAQSEAAQKTGNRAQVPAEEPAQDPLPTLGQLFSSESSAPAHAPAPEEAKVLEVERRFHEQEAYWSISYEGITEFLASDDLLDVLSSSGDVDIEPSPPQQNPAADHVRVRVDIRALKDEVSREDVVRNLTDHVLFMRHGNTLCIKDRHADDEDFDSWRVSITVEVPRSIGADVKTRTGDIRIQRVAGDLTLQSTSGDLSIQAKKSELKNVKLSSAAGSIHLTAGAVAGSLDVSTSAGGVTLDLADPSHMKSAVVRSLTGSLCLTLPKKTPGNFRLQSEDGSLSLSSCKDFQIRKDVSGETAIGQLGKGGPAFDLLSTAGSISLQLR